MCFQREIYFVRHRITYELMFLARSLLYWKSIVNTLGILKIETFIILNFHFTESSVLFVSSSSLNVYWVTCFGH